MEKIAEALVYAVSRISCRDDEGDDDLLDEDVRDLEFIASLIHQATPAEQDALAAAAERARLAAEKASKRPREKFVHDYACWMEEMFVIGWESNRRVPDEG